MHVVIGGASGFLGHRARSPTCASRATRSPGWCARTTRRPTPRCGTRAPAASTRSSSTGRRRRQPVRLVGRALAAHRTRPPRAPRLPHRRHHHAGPGRGRVRRTSRRCCPGRRMGIYGPDRGDEILTETSEPGTGFLSEVVQRWEAAAQPAVDAGARVCRLRTTLPLDRRGGLLGPLVPMFKLGLGARLGSGSAVHGDGVAARLAPGGDVPGRAPDRVRAVQHRHARRRPPTPSSPTRSARRCNRPTVLVAPTFVLKARARRRWPTTCSDRCGSSPPPCSTPASRSTTPTSSQRSSRRSPDRAATRHPSSVRSSTTVRRVERSRGRSRRRPSSVRTQVGPRRSTTSSVTRCSRPVGDAARLPHEHHALEPQSALAVGAQHVGVGASGALVDVDVAQPGLVAGDERLRPDRVEPAEHEALRVVVATTQAGREQPEQPHQRIHPASVAGPVRRRGSSSTAAVGWRT